MPATLATLHYDPSEACLSADGRRTEFFHDILQGVSDGSVTVSCGSNPVAVASLEAHSDEESRHWESLSVDEKAEYVDSLVYFDTNRYIDNGSISFNELRGLISHGA